MELFTASNQWATRPDDERFWTVAEMLQACKAYADNARTALVPLGSLRVEASGDNVALVGKTGVPSNVTHYAFGQLARMVTAPASYLRALPATLACQNLNHGLAALSKARGEDKASLLFHQNGSLVTRAITSDSYDRVWNWEVLERVQKYLVDTGWKVPPARVGPKGGRSRAATETDVLACGSGGGSKVNIGDTIGPAGLYASDHDMFAFLVQEGAIDVPGAMLNRGVFIQNSEVGDCALAFTLFLFDGVCGNHIVWGARDVNRVAVRHIKSERAIRGNTLGNAFRKWRLTARPDSGSVEADVKAAQCRVLGATKDEVLDACFTFAKKRSLNTLNRAVLEAAYETAERTPRYGSPRNVWGMVNGLTQNSQASTYADVRTDMDRQAGRLMEMAF